jgi:hypothetical protein
MKLELEISIDSFGDAFRAAAIGVAAAALLQELQKPPALRTWRGDVLGVVPYDFRPPTLERLMASYWNPAEPALFTPMPFGVGWAINLATLTRHLGRLRSAALAADIRARRSRLARSDA